MKKTINAIVLLGVTTLINGSSAAFTLGMLIAFNSMPMPIISVTDGAVEENPSNKAFVSIFIVRFHPAFRLVNRQAHKMETKKAGINGNLKPSTRISGTIGVTRARPPITPFSW